MRPTAYLALHAALAAVIAAFAASATAAPTFALVAARFKNAGGNYSHDHKEHIEILSYSFGSSQAGAKGGNVEFEWKVEEGESAPPVSGGVRVASGDVDGDGRSARKPTRSTRMLAPGATTPTSDSAIGQAVGSHASDGDEAASGLPSGKRQHKPFTITKEIDKATPQLAKPLAKGSVWIRVASPWTACRVGARYPAIELGDGTDGYVLEDAIVTGCSPQAASFNYAKVTVRAWDPKKKEDVVGQARPR